MTVRLWHFTLSENFDLIRRDGVKDGDFGWVYFCEEGDRCWPSSTNVLVEITIAATLEEVEPFRQPFPVMYRIPAAFVNERQIDVRLVAPDE